MPVAQQHAVSDRDGREDGQGTKDRQQDAEESSDWVDDVPEEDELSSLRPMGWEAFRWMMRYDHLIEPGHKLHRVWKEQGESNGYITVPFAFPVRSLVREEKIVVCLVSLRREHLQLVCKAWEDVLPELPLFDISSEVKVVDAEPLDKGALETIRNKVLELRLPESEWARDASLVQETIKELTRLILVVQCACEGCAEVLQWRFACVDADTSAEAEEDDEDGLSDPDQVDMRQQLRSILVLAGDGIEFIPQPLVSEGSKAAADLGLSQQRWERLASEDWAKAVAKGDVDIATALKRIPAGWIALLKGDGWRGERGTGAAWRMPASGKRLIMEVDVIKRKKPQPPKKLPVVRSPVKYLEDGFTSKTWPFEIAETQPTMVKHSTGSGYDIDPNIRYDGYVEEEEVDALSWLGPLKPAVAATSGALQRSPPFRWGQDRRRDIRAWLKAMQQLDNQTVNENEETTKVMRSMKTGIELDSLNIRAKEEEEDIPLQPIDKDAPVVLLAGAWSEMGRAIFRELHAKGYHVVVHRHWKWRGETSEYRTMVQTDNGASISFNAANIRVAGTPWRVRYMEHLDQFSRLTPKGYRPVVTEDVFSLVAGVDKVIVCACPQPEGTYAPPGSKRHVTKSYVSQVLTSWDRYRQYYTDRIPAFSPKVKLFDFFGSIDPDLWGLEGPSPSDVAYGKHRANWFLKGERAYPCMVFKVITQEASSQATLSSQKLNLNFARFSGLTVDVCSIARTRARFSWFLRMEHFETTRIQYEFPVRVRKKQRLTAYMPFKRFKPVRCDGVPIEPENDVEIPPLDKSKVVQMGIVFRGRRAAEYIPALQESRGDEIELCMFSVSACRRQPETQVVFVNNLRKAKKRDVSSQTTSPSSSSASAGSTEDEEEEEDILDGLIDADDLDDLLESTEEDNEEAEAEAEARARALAVAEAEAALGLDGGSKPLVAAPGKADEERRPRFNTSFVQDHVGAVFKNGFAFKIIYATKDEDEEATQKLVNQGYDFELVQREKVPERAVAALKEVSPTDVLD